MKELRVVLLVVLTGSLAAIVSRGCVGSPQPKAETATPASVGNPAQSKSDLGKSDLGDLGRGVKREKLTPAIQAHQPVVPPVGDSVSKDDTKSADYQEAWDRAIAIWAKGFNRLLPDVARNELGFESTIVEIRRPVWGYWDANSIVGSSAIIYKAKDGAVRVAHAYFTGGKWSIATGDEYNYGPTPEQNANALRVLFEARLERLLDVPD